ncbi:fumarylacetoacetate hydrolase family protein [Mycobacterium sp.]|jgi:2,4-diketo-3-deoxy-L-fuconate hydrolase|uniref:fumarylacetoacetate hydrolase family protein n=1 Tax=Mycobacterium sp. TaxID=1785 RepID=UPI002B56A004|nr:fumarylacetoacetate hydrolase family protein [Mycobacterium sp.]HTH88265.1 fumarylacetoacetate hydrolase family protein [Mycobacterium sp.]
MRIASRAGRLIIVDGDLCTDVATASNDRFGPDPDDIYEHWADFASWAENQAPAPGEPFDPADVDAPLRRPRQVFGIGLNYLDHAAESGVSAPSSPTVFTKFPTCLTGPTSTITLPSLTIDWEVELVVVIGSKAERVSEAQAWRHVAGLTVGQDISERTVQLAGPVPQFSLGKSYPGFGPIGPTVVTPDQLADPDDLELSCSVDGQVLQKGRTSQMIFSVPELIARLSAVCPLLPGDLVFTGTPPGVGMARKPQQWLQPGTTLVSEIKGIGTMRNPIVAGVEYPGPAPTPAP